MRVLSRPRSVLDEDFPTVTCRDTFSHSTPDVSLSLIGTFLDPHRSSLLSFPFPELHPLIYTPKYLYSYLESLVIIPLTSTSRRPPSSETSRAVPRPENKIHTTLQHNNTGDFLNAPTSTWSPTHGKDGTVGIQVPPSTNESGIRTGRSRLEDRRSCKDSCMWFRGCNGLQSSPFGSRISIPILTPGLKSLHRSGNSSSSSPP